MFKSACLALGLLSIIAISAAHADDTCPIAAPPAPTVHYSVMPDDPDGDQRDIV